MNFQISATLKAIIGQNNWGKLEGQAERLQGKVDAVNARIANIGRTAQQSAGVAGRAWGQVGNQARNAAYGVTALGGAFGIFATKAIQANASSQKLELSLSATLNAFNQYGKGINKNADALTKFRGAQKEARKLFGLFEKDALSSVGTTQDRIEAAQTIAGSAFGAGANIDQLRALVNRTLEVGSILNIDAGQAARDISLLISGQAGEDNLTFSRGLKPFLVTQEEIRKSAFRERVTRNKKGEITSRRVEKGNEKSEAEIFKMLGTSEQVRRIFGALNRFASKEVLDENAKLFDTQWSTFSDLITNKIVKPFGAPLTEALNGELMKVNEMLIGKSGKGLSDSAIAFGQKVVQGVGRAKQGFDQLTNWWNSTGKPFVFEARDGFMAVANTLERIAKVGKGAMDILGQAGGWIGGKVKGAGQNLMRGSENTNNEGLSKAMWFTGDFLANGLNTNITGGNLAGGALAAAGTIAALRGLNNLFGGLPGRGLAGAGKGLLGLPGMLFGLGKGKGGPTIPGAPAGVTPVYVVNMGAGGIGGNLGPAGGVGKGAGKAGNLLQRAGQVARGAASRAIPFAGQVLSKAALPAAVFSAAYGATRFIMSKSGLDEALTKKLADFRYQALYSNPGVTYSPSAAQLQQILQERKAPQIQPLKPTFNNASTINMPINLGSINGLDPATVGKLKVALEANNRAYVQRFLAEQQRRVQAQLEASIPPSVIAATTVSPLTASLNPLSRP